MLNYAYDLLNKLRLPHGLYLAALNSHYRYVWIRDSVYMSLPYIDKQDGYFEKSVHRLFDMFIEYEWKIKIHSETKPVANFQYIHSRFSADDVREIHNQEWGHVQHDAIGGFLFIVGKGHKLGRKVFRNEKDKEILSLLVKYLETCEYWHDVDNGMWEEAKEIHSSSIGAIVAGLKEIKDIVDVPDELIQKGEESLYSLFPFESHTKLVDLAQLSLIYPYRLLSNEQATQLLNNVEEHLVRTNGVIRYKGDSYFSTLEEKYGRDKPSSFYCGTEMEWTFGFPWLSLCYNELGDKEKAEYYLEKSENIMIEPGVFPEGYFAHTKTPCPNSPLGWSSAMYILAKEKAE